MVLPMAESCQERADLTKGSQVQTVAQPEGRPDGGRSSEHSPVAQEDSLAPSAHSGAVPPLPAVFLSLCCGDYFFLVLSRAFRIGGHQLTWAAPSQPKSQGQCEEGKM